MMENLQQFLVVSALATVLSAALAVVWRVFSWVLDMWAEKSSMKYPAGPRKRMAIRRRRIKAAVIAGVLMAALMVAAPAPARHIQEQEPEPVPTIQAMAVARNLAKISVDNAELHIFLKDYPAYVKPVLVDAGVDLVKFCNRYPEYSYILLDVPPEGMG